MMLICFHIEKVYTVDKKKKLVKLPAVIFSNSSFDQTQLEKTNPEIKGIRPSATYSVDAEPNAVPLDVLLYDEKRVLDIISYTQSLEEEIIQLKKDLDIHIQRESLLEGHISNSLHSQSEPISNLGANSENIESDEKTQKEEILID
jgi:hypothetical protein